MTDEAPGPGAGGPGPRYFVRRVPDVTTRWGRRRSCYEVGTFAWDSSIPSQVQRTRTPETVLLRAGLHTTDIADYRHNADAVWDGGTGPWRSLWPERDPSSSTGRQDQESVVVARSEPELVLPQDFDDYAWELESKGWYPDASVRYGGRQVAVTFYDPTRLAQDIEADLAAGHLVSIAHLVVVERLTVENMRRAVRRLDRAFFDPS